MTATLDRLVRQLDTWRPGDDASALIELVPLARRRNDAALLERLARCFVDPQLSAHAGHLLTLPTSSELVVDHEALRRSCDLCVENQRAAWARGIDALATLPIGRLLAAATGHLERLARTSDLPLHDDEIEAVTLHLSGGMLSCARVIDRWAERGGLARALRLLACAAGFSLRNVYPNNDPQTLLERMRPVAIDLGGQLRLLHWFNARPELVPDLHALRRELRATRLDEDMGDALLAFLLGDREPAFIDELLERFTAPLARDELPRSSLVLANVVAVVRPGHGEALGKLLQQMVRYPERVCDFLPHLADRLGEEAVAPLVAFREQLSHHKYTGLVAQAIARIPSRSAVRILANELGHKSRGRADDAARACVLHPVEAMLELPQLAAVLAANTERKGKADRARQIAAIHAMLDELARVHPRAIWIVLPLVGDTAIVERLTSLIPESLRQESALDAPTEDERDRAWILELPVPPSARRSPLDCDEVQLADAHGPLSREHIRRLLLALSVGVELEPRVELLRKHLDAEQLALFADTLLAVWNDRGRQRYDALWVFALAARVGDTHARRRARELLSNLFSRRRVERFNGAIAQIRMHGSPAVVSEILGILRNQTRSAALRHTLDDQLTSYCASLGLPPLAALPLPFADGLLPVRSRSARAKLIAETRTLAVQLLEACMLGTTGVPRDDLVRNVLRHPLLEASQVEGIIWARVREGALEDIVAGPLDAAPDGEYRPLHPAEITAERWGSNLEQLLASGRQPAPWQAGRVVWREGDPPPLGERLHVAPAWALRHLLEVRRWLRNAEPLPNEAWLHTALPRSLIAPMDGSGVCLEIAPHADHVGNLEVRLQRAPATNPVALSEAMREVSWLAEAPGSGDELRRWRKARGLDLPALAKRWGIAVTTLESWELASPLYASPELVEACTGELT